MCLLVSLVFSHRIQVLKQPWPRLCYPHTPLIQVTVSPASAQTCPASKSPFRHCPTPALEPKGFRTRKDSITVESSLSWRSTSWPATPPSGTSRTSMNSSALCQVATIMFLGFLCHKWLKSLTICLLHQAARRSLKSSALRRSMAKPWCSSKRIISWAPWTSNWAQLWKSLPASVCSRTRSLSHSLI